MKRDHLLSILIDGMFACLMAIAGAGCLSTAFDLHVNMQAVSLCALLFALPAVIFPRLRGGWILLAITMLGSFFLLRRLDAASNFLSLLNRILPLYSKAYGWAVPEHILAYQDWDLTLSMQVIAALCALFSGIYLSRKLDAFSVLAVILPLLPCIVVTDTVPDANFLLLGIMLVALLALTNHARHTDQRQANRLTLLLLMPVLLCGTLLMNRFPHADYEKPDIGKGMFALMEQLAEHIPFLNGNSTDPEATYPSATDQVHLDTAGPHPQKYAKILEVVASQSGALYLRGRSYMGYTGLAWEAWPEQTTLDPISDPYGIDQVQTIQIRPLLDRSVRYFPYYPTSAVQLVDGALDAVATENYLFSYRPLRSDWKRLWSADYATLGIENSSYALLQDYLQLPNDTQTAALRHLQLAGVTEKSSIVQIVERIREYVTASATYDLDTPRIPSDETDFARWFLDEMDTGYCVHFATAATVLLRAAGIPARYVEGYLVDAKAGRSTAVRGENAHAWVEYFVPHVGWVILETTPAEGLPVVLPTQPPETTQTTPPTQVTRPTFPTMPPETTLPTEPTEPAFPTTPDTKPTLPDPPTTAPTVPSQPTTPAGTTHPGGIGNQGGSGIDWTPLLTILGWIGKLLAMAAIAIGQWYLRLQWRKKWLAGRDYVHIHRRWRYACMLAKLCGHKQPKPLLELLKKAKFSRNGLNDRELDQFARYQQACIRGLAKKPWPLRLLLRLVLAIW